MKKVFWGVLLAMAGLPTIVTLVLSFLPGGSFLFFYGMSTLIAGLGTAAGYYLIMRGSEDLPQTQSWHYAGTFSKVLCAYEVAVTLLQYVEQMQWFTFRLPGIVGSILFFITDMSSFLVMYFCVLGVRELEYVSRRTLFARQINTCFTVWVVVRMLASLLWSGLYLVSIGAYIVMLVFYGRAAWAYGDSKPYQQF